MIGRGMGTWSVPAAPYAEREDAMRTTTSKKKLTEQAAELVEQVSPHVDAARERIVNDYLPAAQSMLADARDVAREVAQDAREAAQEAAANAEKSTRKSRKKAARRARAKAGELATKAGAAAPLAAPLAAKVADKVEPKPRRKKRFLLLAALVGAGAVAFKKLRGESGGTPYAARPESTPRPRAVPDPAVATTPTPPAPPETHFEPDPETPATDPSADALVDAGPGATTGETTDAGGAFLDEVIADGDEEPHKVTTPDHPAEVEDVSETPARHSRKR
jgi:hypothetical protein